MKRYQGTVDGSTIQSLYPNVYRVQCVVYIGSRRYDIDQAMPALDEYHARERAQNRWSDIRGGITVEKVGELSAY